MATDDIRRVGEGLLQFAEANRIRLPKRLLAHLGNAPDSRQISWYWLQEAGKYLYKKEPRLGYALRDYVTEAALVWWEHVRQTPAGMVPCVINHCIYAYQSAMGADFTSDKLPGYFADVPEEYWPDWRHKV